MRRLRARRALEEGSRERRRLRIRRRGRRAYIRSVYSLPSLATLGNAICGFAAMYISTLDWRTDSVTHDPWTLFFVRHSFFAASYLIFAAMLFDAVDGRLARFARHTTDFGGQLDSLADAISFGAAPAFLAIQLFHWYHADLASAIVTRLIWAIGALYMSCALIRLARFNVSNEHGEQHHFSFLGLPSPGAAGVVAAFVLMQQDLAERAFYRPELSGLADDCVWILPLVVLGTGLLMVSAIRYPHLVNRYLRGRRSIGRVLLVLIGLLMLVVAHRYTLSIGTLAYAGWGPIGWIGYRLRQRRLRQTGLDNRVQ
jgi:CDP-diacylglycerol--serine O-phosphatidyltransferase